MSGSLIWMSAVLLVGVLLLGAGYFGQSRMALYVGGLITLAGVLNGVMLIVVHPGR